MINMEALSAGISIKTRINSFFVQCVRVWHLLKKPTKDEFIGISKVSAIGILLIGVMGFIVSDIIKWIVG